MFDIDKIRSDFPILKETMKNNPLIYFDSAATSLKPQVVIDEVVEYYTKLSSNAHRGDYDLSYKVDTKFSAARKNVAKLLNSDEKEIVFTSGTTEGINIIARSYAKKFLQPGDEIIISYAEHASNVLPWYNLADEIGVKIVFCPLNVEGNYSLDNLKTVITKNTKLIAFAHVSNTLADVRDAKAICQYAKAHNIITVIDGAQSIPHMAIDVQDLECDFLTFSAHKMCGPTGVGVLYGKYELLEQMNPYNLGGGMNARFNKAVEVSYKSVPTVFEAGTQNIAGIFGLSKAIDYLREIGFDNIHNYELELKQYAVSKMSQLPNVKIYNASTASGVVIFNVFDDGLVFPQDVASFLNEKGIAIRAGDHCAKLLDNVIDTRVTCRASFYLYNTKAEIDKFVDELKQCNSESVLLF